MDCVIRLLYNPFSNVFLKLLSNIIPVKQGKSDIFLLICRWAWHHFKCGTKGEEEDPPPKDLQGIMHVDTQLRSLLLHHQAHLRSPSATSQTPVKFQTVLGSWHDLRYLRYPHTNTLLFLLTVAGFSVTDPSEVSTVICRFWWGHCQVQYTDHCESVRSVGQHQISSCPPSLCDMPGIFLSLSHHTAGHPSDAPLLAFSMQSASRWSMFPWLACNCTCTASSPYRVSTSSTSCLLQAGECVIALCVQKAGMVSWAVRCAQQTHNKGEFVGCACEGGQS